MAHGSDEFVLVGYSEALERKASEVRGSHSCDLDLQLTFSLLCGHVLCEPCYQSSATTSECVCPLDGDVSGADDVTSKKYPPDNQLKRKVHCWNEANGCRVVLPASHVAEHVRNDCQHHVTRCPTCSAVVLTRDVCAHLKSRCTALVFLAASDPQQRTDNKVTTELVAFERKVEQRVSELDGRLAQLSLECGLQNEKLVELCHNINHLKEELRQQLGTSSGQTLDRLDRNAAEVKALVAHEKTVEHRVREIDNKLAKLSLDSGSQRDKLVEVCRNISDLKEALTGRLEPASVRSFAEIKALYTEKSDSLMTALTSLFTAVPSDCKTHQWVLTGYAALKEKALKDGRCDSWSDKVYLRRYLMSWGISFMKAGESVNLYLILNLHEGREDGFLDWPFTKELKLTFIHPESRQEMHRAGKTDLSEATRPSYCRPIKGSNISVRFLATEVASGDIERDGYVKSDQLLLRLEVLL
ncbi:hypothetical protein HPB48_021258 [Haemaphysalis longicornis]|uniref:TRAF1-6 MATH domain-containing protein n=1 Tax=Haemaphysalis longicornis TaxID=44386 RepID=A0A9J6FRD1_HAELO|nr:hypothetical protein HPB48_021258 [Haemaphysalis longicornis]